MSTSSHSSAPDELGQSFDLSSDPDGDVITNPLELKPLTDEREKSDIHTIPTIRPGEEANDTEIEDVKGSKMDRESQHNIDEELERIRDLALQAAIPKFTPSVLAAAHIGHKIDDDHYAGIEHALLSDPDGETIVDIEIAQPKSQ